MQDFQSEASIIGGFKNGSAGLPGKGSYLVVMAAVFNAIASASQIHPHTPSLCSFCSEQTAIKQQIALLGRAVSVNWMPLSVHRSFVL